MAGRTTDKGRKNPLGLTDQQLAFCRFYAQTLHVGIAYESAGYSVKTRNSRDACGSQLLRNPKIQAYLKEVMNLDEVSTINAVTAIAFCEITEILKFDGRELIVKQTDHWSDRAKLAVKKIKYKGRKRSISSSEEDYLDGDAVALPLEELIDFEIEVELYDRLNALDKLMRKMRLYPKDEPVVESGASQPDQDQREAARAIVLEEVFGLHEDDVRSVAAVPETMDPRSRSAENLV